MSRRFDGRVAIVTGAGGGLGRAHALLLAQYGAAVVVNDLGGSMSGDGASATPADKVVGEIKAAGGEAVANYDSVTDGNKIVQTALDVFGRVDIVINNAGILRDVSFHNMTDADWNLIQEVHLRGSYKVTHAAWPHLREQQYGRVIMTTSAAGLYGNFGQANYSAAKLGLLGLANTLAIEGAKRNIHVNTIAPVAGSRLTETILPAELVSALKPEYVSPLVVYLCHETCAENGGVFEVGAGWVAKVRWQRAKGKFFPLQQSFTPDDVAEHWAEIVNWEDPVYPERLQDSFGPIMINLETAKQKRGNEFIDLDKVLGYKFPVQTTTYTPREVSLYALGVGAGVNPTDPMDLGFVYEGNMAGFHALPTMAVTFPFSIISHITNVPGLSFNPMMLLHGEQYLELKKPLPTAGKLTHHGHISHVYDKGKGAVVIVEVSSRDEQGEEVVHNEYSLFIRGFGNFGGERGPAGEANQPPNRPPDISHTEQTAPHQALLYRLSGDFNPLHADPAMAALGGFDKPILHGLCTFGFAGRALLKHIAQNKPASIKSIKVRFAKHVFPGETLITEMWQESPTEVIFQCKVAERNEIVLSQGLLQLHPASNEPAKPKEKLDKGAGQVLEAFGMVNKRINQQPELMAQIGAVYLFELEGAGRWFINLKDDPIGAGELAEGIQLKADCTIKMTGRDFLDLVAGKLNPQMAFMQGKLKVAGDIALATKLEAILKN